MPPTITGPVHGLDKTHTPACAFPPDRRRRARTVVQWPVTLARGGSEAVETVTQNLSSSGFYCLSQTLFTPGETLACVLRIPTHDPKREDPSLRLACRAVVLRAEASPDRLFGIACRIDDYHLVAVDSPGAAGLPDVLIAPE